MSISHLIGMEKLTKIHNEFKFNRVGDKIVLAHKAESLGFVYKFDASLFPFNGDTIAFINYKEFSGLLSMINPESAKIIHEPNSMHITLVDDSKGAKINYTLTNPEIDLHTGNIDFTFPNPDASITLEQSEFIKIRKFSSAISAKKIKLSIIGDECKMKFFKDGNPDRNDSVDMTFKTDFEVINPINYDISTDIFTTTPDADVSMLFTTMGLVGLQYAKEDLVILTGEVKKY